MCGVKCQDQDVVSLAQVMGCRIGSLPINYLGLPLGANPRRVQTWQPMIDRLEKKLAVWKRRFMSFGDSAMGNVIQDGFRIQVYSENNTSFWNHKWMGDQTLREEFPRLYLKSSQRDELVCTVLNSTVSRGGGVVVVQRWLCNGGVVVAAVWCWARVVVVSGGGEVVVVWWRR
ncbi:hypothetical protein RHMOL_Rhmol03G0047500 [Rhododendron molle]|uniref:Uncharacterized protein n=1 Tax=Rhododendron molle TaxID=49168 RepID=A0ACC0PCW7_RHOML|nr:hypothetical protein RHMOL_Rhmol03G0047500 [Rhododendron molle]